MKQLIIFALMVMSLAGQNIQHTRRYTIKGGRMAEFESIVNPIGRPGADTPEDENGLQAG
jgi:hypothetical protein